MSVDCICLYFESSNEKLEIGGQPLELKKTIEKTNFFAVKIVKY